MKRQGWSFDALQNRCLFVVSCCLFFLFLSLFLLLSSSWWWWLWWWCLVFDAVQRFWLVWSPTRLCPKKEGSFCVVLAIISFCESGPNRSFECPSVFKPPFLYPELFVFISCDCCHHFSPSALKKPRNLFPSSHRFLHLNFHGGED